MAPHTGSACGPSPNHRPKVRGTLPCAAHNSRASELGIMLGPISGPARLRLARQESASPGRHRERAQPDSCPGAPSLREPAGRASPLRGTSARAHARLHRDSGACARAHAVASHTFVSDSESPVSKPGRVRRGGAGFQVRVLSQSSTRNRCCGPPPHLIVSDAMPRCRPANLNPNPRHSSDAVPQASHRPSLMSPLNPLFPATQLTSPRPHPPRRAAAGTCSAPVRRFKLPGRRPDLLRARPGPGRR